MTAVCEASVGLFSLRALWNQRWNDPGERKLKQGLFSGETEKHITEGNEAHKERWRQILTERE